MKSKTKLWLGLSFTIVILIAAFFRFYRLADYPLGIFFDPAINGLDAVRLLQRGGPVIFFPTNGGREAFFIYLLAAAIWLFGTTPFAIRLVTTSLSLLTVALLFACLYDVTRFTALAPERSEGVYDLRFTLHAPRPTPHHSRPSLHAPRPTSLTLPLSLSLWFATLASLTLAVSYWPVAVSRLGQRPILVPLLAVPIFWLFLRGWATGQRRWFVVSGLLLGLAGHTYSAARLIPLILVLALLPEFFMHPQPEKCQLKLRLANLASFGLAALVVYLPMAWYLLSYPAQFTARAGSVMIWNFLDSPSEILSELGRNVLRVAGFFCCTGSPNPIFGPPGYPGSSLLLLPFLLIGLVGAVANWRNLFLRLVALWWLIGLVPSILAIEAPHPWRMIVAIVPTAILIALGLILSIDWLQSRFPLLVPRPTLSAPRSTSSAPRSTPYLLALLLILLPTSALFRAYFIDWTRLQATRGAYDYAAITLRDEILSRANQPEPLYLPLTRLNDSTLLYYLSGSFERNAAVTTSPAEKASAISPDRNATDSTWVRLQNGIATLLPPLTAAGQELIQTALAGDAAQPIRTGDGETVAQLAFLPTDPVLYLQQPTVALTATFGPLDLTGATYPPLIEPAQATFPVTLFWQANRPTSNEYEILVRLVDDQGRAWGNGDARPADWVYPTSFWRPGLDQIAAQHEVRLTEGTALPPGRYWLALSVFDPAQNRRLPLTAVGSNSLDTLLVGPLKSPLPAPPPLDPLAAGDITFGDIIRLVGARLDQSSVWPGDSLEFELLWQSLGQPELDYTVFSHLLDEQDQIVAGYDSQPVNDSYPTSLWSPGERVLDRHLLPIPASLPPGRYHLAIGLYYQPTGQRLPAQLTDGTIIDQGRYIFTRPITVEAPE